MEALTKDWCADAWSAGISLSPRAKSAALTPAKPRATSTDLKSLWPCELNAHARSIQALIRRIKGVIGSRAWLPSRRT